MTDRDPGTSGGSDDGTPGNGRDRGVDGDPNVAQPEVADVAGELADLLEDLAADLRRRNRGPFGLPAPPRPEEVLRFTDEYAIPVAIAVLEANVRSLELLQGAIRLAERGERAGDGAAATRERARAVSQTTLDRLDGVLDDLETALRGDELPESGAAGDVLREARELRSDLDAALDGDSPDAASHGDGTTDGAATGETATTRPGEQGDEDGAIDDSVDVEAELRSIKAELDDGVENGDAAEGGDAAVDAGVDDEGDGSTAGEGDGDSTAGEGDGDSTAGGDVDGETE